MKHHRTTNAVGQSVRDVCESVCETVVGKLGNTLSAHSLEVKVKVKVGAGLNNFTRTELFDFSDSERAFGYAVSAKRARD